MGAVAKAINNLVGYEPQSSRKAKAAVRQSQAQVSQAQNKQASEVTAAQAVERRAEVDRVRRILKGKIGLLGFGESGETGIFGG